MTNNATIFRQLRQFLLPVLISLLLSLISISCADAKSGQTLRPAPEHSSQSKKIIKTLEKYHYLEKDFKDNLSSVALDRYIKRLDRSKQLFTSADVRQFKTYRFRLDNELKKGDLRTAFKIFNLYLDRAKERLEYVLSLSREWEGTFDFTLDESMVIDDDTRQWQEDEEGLYRLWKKGLKNHIITMKLEGKDADKITEMLDKIYTNRQKRLLQTDANDAFHIFINSVTSSFDPHTAYMPPRQSEDFDIDMSKSLEGIGAVLINEYEYTKVVSLVPKGPADKSKLLMPGDKIIGVGQGKTGEIKDTIGQRIDRVVQLIRGPKNSYVRLKIIPAKNTDSTRTIQIRRDKVKLEDQSAKKQVITVSRSGRSYKLGVIEIPNFYMDFEAYRRRDPDYKSTTRDVKKLLAELKAEKIDGLIVDLRDNGGGSLDEANNLTGLFLKSGPTVQVKDKRETRRWYDNDPRIEYEGPLVVLINRMSASASEIFAGAIRDYNRGVIVGTRSHGKGTVQQVLPLGNGRLKLTSAKFYRVSGESTQNLGVVPDLKYPQIYKVEETGESSLEGALPWDITVKSSYQAYRPLMPVIDKLNDAYRNRALADPGLNYLKTRLQLTAKITSETAVSLNLADRKSRKQHYEQLDLEIENDYLTAMGKPLLTDENQDTAKRVDYKQILMEQTHLVLADFIGLSRQMGYQW